MVYREANPPHRRGHGEEGSDSWVPQVVVIHTCDCLSVVFLNWTPMCWQGTRQDLWYVAMEMYLLCATKMHLCFELCTAECRSIESCSGEATPLIKQGCQMTCLCEVVFMNGNMIKLIISSFNTCITILCYQSAERYLYIVKITRTGDVIHPVL